MAWEHLVSEKATTLDTVKLMLEYIRRYSGQKEVADIIKILPDPNSAEFLPALFEFVAVNISYERDPEGTEKVYAPSALIREGIGDCKKMTGLIASVLREVGIPVLIKVVSYEGKKWSHVYPVVPMKDGSFVIMDVVNNKQFNKEVRHANSMVFDLKGKQMELVGMGSLNGVYDDDEVTGVGQTFASIDSDIMAISTPEMAMGQPFGEDEDVEDSEIEIYSIAGMGFMRFTDEFDEYGMGRRRSKAERKARRKAKKAKRKTKRKDKKLARKARKTARKDKRKFIKSLPKDERKAVRKKWRKARKTRRKFARGVKKMGKSEGLPGPISKFIGKYPELFLAYFLKNNNPEIELTAEGSRKWNRVSRAVNKIKKRKKVDPATLLAFVDTVIEKKYGMPAEEYALVFIHQTATERLSGTGMGLGEPVTAVVIAAIAAASAIATAIIGTKKSELNSGDVPTEGDVFLPEDGEPGNKTSPKRKKKIGEWLKDNGGALLAAAGTAAAIFKQKHGRDPEPGEIDADEVFFDEDGNPIPKPKEEDDNKILGLDPPVAIGIAALGAFLLLRK